jgi:DNA-binding MarR family transcriptional regulator
MNNNQEEKYAEDLLTVPPLIFRSIRRKLVKSLPTDTDFDISPIHFEIMALLREAGTLHAAEIGERLQIARAQMTRLLDKLVDSGIVKRQINKSDRRMTNIKLTAKGRAFLEESDIKIKEAIKETLSCLDEKELQELSDSLITLRKIFTKLV